MSALGNFDFEQLKSCPTLYPSEDEFEDSIQFINQNRSLGEHYGMIKIVPPCSWNPPFNLIPSVFKFKPQRQVLNQINLINQKKIQYVEYVTKFWETKNVRLKTPCVNGELVDLYELQSVVHQIANTYEMVTKNRLWAQVAKKMGYQDGKTIGYRLKNLYSRILLPFEEHLAIVNKIRNGDPNLTPNDNRRRSSRLNLANNSTLFQITNEIDFYIRSNNRKFKFSKTIQHYTFEEFSRKAREFEKNYFGGIDVSTSVVEKEYWKHVNSFVSPLSVEYGAYLLSNHSCIPIVEFNPYTISTWNLNNLPNVNGSVLKYLFSDIYGLTKSRKYIGMCFSTFCWHTEEHWTNSMSYNHFGKPKVWYCIPGDQASIFENVMSEIAPEIFINQPDFLQQRVTTIDPHLLIKHGIKVYRAVQNAREFIVIFPRSYHAGFNQGYNFSETVNFALPSWLPIGRESIKYYAKLKIDNLFSHNELLCRIARSREGVNLSILNACINDSLSMLNEEKYLRNKIVKAGVRMVAMSNIPRLSTAKRQCRTCKTMLFISAVLCPCETHFNNLVCLNHFRDICETCPTSNLRLHIWYTLLELSEVVRSFQNNRYIEMIPNDSDPGYES